MDFLATRKVGFWPDNFAKSLAMRSKVLSSFESLPTPTFMTTFVSFGVAMMLAILNSFCKAGAVCFRYCSIKCGMSVAQYYIADLHFLQMRTLLSPSIR